MMPDILISPESPLVDEKLQVVIHGLQAHQNTTIKASTFEGNSQFSSFACYTADKNGSISLAKHSSLSGTYTGHGPFPGVIDMFGTVGGIMEFRAAMLANKGFITFALCYMTYDVKEIKTSYLQNKAVVNINGPPFNSLAPLAPFDNYVEMNHSAALTVQPDDSVVLRTMDAICENLTSEKLTQTWRTDVQILYLVGEDDQSLHPRCAQMFQETYPQSKRHNLTIVRYPETGHLIELPYLPICPSNNKTYLVDIFGEKIQKEVILMWGGEKEAHATAQEDSWNRIIMFFNTVLLKKNVYSLNSQL